MKLTVRKGNSQDRKAILDMAEEFWKHTIYDDPFDREYVATMLNLAYQQDMVVVLDKEGEGPVGFTCAVASPILGNGNALAALELAFWINKDQRGQSLAPKLLVGLETLAKRVGVKYMNLVAMENLHPEIAIELYESMDHKKNETIYTKVLKQWQLSQAQ